MSAVSSPGPLERSARSLLGDRVLLVAILIASLATVALGATREQLGFSAALTLGLAAVAGISRALTDGKALRYVYTFVLVGLVALQIQLAGGQVEYHFGVFVVLAFLLVYLDWTVIVFGAALFAADLDKSQRKGGKYDFTADAFLPPDAIRGELAEKWEMKQNPLRVEVTLRKGIMFPAKPGVMEARELTSDDVVGTFERLNKSPKKIPVRTRPRCGTSSSGKASATSSAPR